MMIMSSELSRVVLHEDGSFSTFVRFGSAIVSRIPLLVGAYLSASYISGYSAKESCRFYPTLHMFVIVMICSMKPLQDSGGAIKGSDSFAPSAQNKVNKQYKERFTQDALYEIYSGIDFDA